MSFQTVYEAMQKRAALNKEAGPVGDIAGSVGWGMVPYVGPMANAVGAYHGLGAAVSPEAEAKLDENAAAAWIPGVGASRQVQRLRNQLTADDGSSHRYWSTVNGQFTGNILPAAVGGTVGAIVGRKYLGDDGAVIGGLTGAGLSMGAVNLLAALAAASTKRRTKAEQQEAAASGSGVAADYLVPGVAAYNYWKSVGRSIGDAEERKGKTKDKAQEEDKPEEKQASDRSCKTAALVLRTIAAHGLK